MNSNKKMRFYAGGFGLLCLIYATSILTSERLPFITWKDMSTLSAKSTLIDMTEIDTISFKYPFKTVLKRKMDDFYSSGQSLIVGKKGEYELLHKPIYILSREEDQSRLIVSLFVEAGIDSVYFIRGGLVSLKKKGGK